MKNHHGQTLIVGDAHVHLHDCFDPLDVIEAAHANFDRAVQQYAGRIRFTGLLLLTEGERENGYERLLDLLEQQNDTDDAGLGGWRLRNTEENTSLALDFKGEKSLIVISGRQVVSREDLEVLAIGTRKAFRPGLAIEDLLQEVMQAGALPVIPWGFGKWTGTRGKRIKRLIQNPDRPFFFVGDNANRPVQWPLSTVFSLAEREGIRNLPGSDPLPFQSEHKRPGCSGFIIEGPFDCSKPCRAIKMKLTDENTVIERFGYGETPSRFVRNQLAMQYRKRIRRKRVIA